jgi:hypothetical protein
MQKSYKTFSLFLASAMLLFLGVYSCKKTDPPPPPPPPVVNYLCDGTGQSTYYPLKTGYKWDYNETGSGTSFYEVNLNKTFGGHTYFEVKFKSSVDNINYYYRNDSVGNTIRYYEPDLAEYMYIPINPVMGQTIATYTTGGKRVVSGVNQTITTSSCTYTGLLKIDDINGSGVGVDTWYYKKGLGAVQSMGYFNVKKLTTVTF